jgi:hypothetical protein
MKVKRRNFLKVAGITAGAGILSLPTFGKESSLKTAEPTDNRLEGVFDRYNHRGNCNDLNDILKIKREVYKKWKPTGMLKNLPMHDKIELACILENMRLWLLLETAAVQPMERRILIPLVTRAYHNAIARQIVSVQSLLGPNQVAYHLNTANRMLGVRCAAGTRKLKACYQYEAAHNLQAVHGLNAEAELTAVLAQEIGLDGDREIIQDLRQNAFSFGKIRSLKELSAFQQEKLKIKSWRGRNRWIVTSPEIAMKMIPKEKEPQYFYSSLTIHSRGEYEGYEVYQDPLFPADQILAGSKTRNPYGAGYVYMPYIALSMTPVVLDADTFCPRKGFLTRYAKRLMSPNYYVRATA